MKKTVLLLLVVLFTCSCKNKHLWEGEDYPSQPVQVRFNWLPTQPIPEEGMRINVFSTNELPAYGIDDISSQGATIPLALGAQVATLGYSYNGNKIYFRNENNLDLIEAYTASASRLTYNKTYPNEETYAEPAGLFYVAYNPLFEVTPSTEPLTLYLDPVNVVKTYTFEVRNVKGAQFITATRGAISGMSNSIFLKTLALSTTTSTLLFNATAIKTENKITGSFQTFGSIGSAINNFTIEILYPSTTNGIIQKSWDVSDQVAIVGNYHIIIDNSGIEVPDEGIDPGETDSGFTANVDEWETETVILH